MDGWIDRSLIPLCDYSNRSVSSITLCDYSNRSVSSVTLCDCIVTGLFPVLPCVTIVTGLFPVLPTLTLELPDTAPFYQTSAYHTLSCHYSGSPVPDVHWSWQPCPHPQCQPSPFEWTSVTTSRNTPTVQDYPESGLSELFIPARETGFYQCVINNKVGGDSNVTHFIASGQSARVSVQGTE